MVRKAVKAGRADEWSELMKSDEFTPWMMTKLQESCYQAKQDDDQRKSVARQIMQRSTDFLRRIIVPVEGQGGVTVVRVPSPPPISARRLHLVGLQSILNSSESIEICLISIFAV